MKDSELLAQLQSKCCDLSIEASNKVNSLLKIITSSKWSYSTAEIYVQEAKKMTEWALWAELLGHLVDDLRAKEPKVISKSDSEIQVSVVVPFEYGNSKYDIECLVNVTATCWGIEYDTMEVLNMKIGGVDVFDLFNGVNITGHKFSVGSEICDLAYEQAEKELSERDEEDDE